MSDPQNQKAKSQVPLTPGAEETDCTDQAAPKDYYYDDSTGYEIYEGPEEDDEDSAVTSDD
jgi:hypothetical protein